MQITHQELEKAIIRSQHCQRNWDISKNIPQEDLELIIHAVSNCPSKQNHAFYKVYAVVNRNIIESIHATTEGFLLPNGEWTTNSQTLANLLLVFEAIETSDRHKIKNHIYENGSKATSTRDSDMAIGIAAGYANLISNILGYKTGCCACFDGTQIQQILGMTNGPSLLMGIGFGDPDRSRRLHHVTNQLFPTKTKEKISVEII
jgi:hypothetical protein